MKTRSKTAHGLLQFGAECISQLLSEQRFGTARNYGSAISSFRKFLASTGRSSRLSAEQLDREVISAYNGFLREQGVIRNTISFYNRVLRSIYNKEVRAFGIADKHPFDDVYTGIDKTCNRSVTIADVARLSALDLSENPELEWARDVFLFSFAMRGMPFVDIAYLKKRNISDGYVTYSRHKTGGTLRIRIEPEATRIIEKYACNGDYVFPFLASEGASDTYRVYRSALVKYNRQLKLLSAMLGCGITLTSYTSRHTWAHIAHNSDIPLSIISVALGHSSERMTRIYIGSLEASSVDDANRRLLQQIGG